MAIGADCMVVGLAGLLGVATQTDPEAIYDAIIQLRAKAEAIAARVTEAADAVVCGEVSAKGNSDPCARPAGHKMPHRAADGSTWRVSRINAGQVPESQPAPQ